MIRWIGICTILLLLIVSGCKKPETIPAQPQVLRVLLWDSPQTANPNEDFDSVTDSVLFNVFEPLIRLDTNLHLEPALATSWSNPRPEVWRFHIRKDVKFSDGTPLTATIVKQSLLETQQSRYEISSFLESVQKIEVLDDLTVDLITDSPHVLPIKIPFIYICLKTNSKSFPYIGTGPYQVTAWKPEEQIELQWNSHYWDGAPDFKHAQFKPVRDAARRWEMLASGQADIMYSIASFKAQEPAKGIHIIRRTGLAVYYLGFNLRNDTLPFHDPKIRKAIALALDRGGLIQDVLHGYGSVASQPVSPFVFGYNSAIQPLNYDLMAAQKLMAETEYPEGFTTRLDFSESRKNVGLYLQRQLLKIKIRLELNGLPRSEVYDLAEQGKSDLFLVGWDCSSGDAGEFYEFNLHTPTERYGIGNYGGYSNAELDRICERHNEVLTDRNRKVLLQRAAEIVMRDLPVLPLFMEDDLYALKETLTFEPRAEGQIRLFDVKWRNPSR